MNLFGSKKGKTAKGNKKGSTGSVSGKDDLPEQPSWPSLSPAPSMTSPRAEGKAHDSSLLETQASDLIASYPAALTLQVGKLVCQDNECLRLYFHMCTCPPVCVCMHCTLQLTVVPACILSTHCMSCQSLLHALKQAHGAG